MIIYLLSSRHSSTSHDSGFDSGNDTVKNNNKTNKSKKYKQAKAVLKSQLYVTLIEALKENN